MATQALTDSVLRGWFPSFPAGHLADLRAVMHKLNVTSADSLGSLWQSIRQAETQSKFSAQFEQAQQPVCARLYEMYRSVLMLPDFRVLSHAPTHVLDLHKAASRAGACIAHGHIVCSSAAWATMEHGITDPDLRAIVRVCRWLWWQDEDDEQRALMLRKRLREANSPATPHMWLLGSAVPTSRRTSNQQHTQQHARDATPSTVVTAVLVPTASCVPTSKQLEQAGDIVQAGRTEAQHQTAKRHKRKRRKPPRMTKQHFQEHVVAKLLAALLPNHEVHTLPSKAGAAATATAAATTAADTDTDSKDAIMPSLAIMPKGSKAGSVQAAAALVEVMAHDADSHAGSSHDHDQCNQYQHLESWLQAHPGASMARSLLFDGTDSALMSVQLHEMHHGAAGSQSKVQWWCSPEISLLASDGSLSTEAWQVIAAVVNSEAGTMPIPLPRQRRPAMYRRTAFLGFGGSGLVWQLEPVIGFRKPSLVLKQARYPKDSRVIRAEHETLVALAAAAVKHVPKPVQFIASPEPECGLDMLIMEPLGTPLLSVNDDILEANVGIIAKHLFETLRGIHEAGFLHMDLRALNMLVVLDGDVVTELIVNDFDAAQPMTVGADGTCAGITVDRHGYHGTPHVGTASYRLRHWFMKKEGRVAPFKVPLDEACADCITLFMRDEVWSAMMVLCVLMCASANATVLDELYSGGGSPAAQRWWPYFRQLAELPLHAGWDAMQPIVSGLVAQLTPPADAGQATKKKRQRGHAGAARAGAGAV